MSLDIDDADAIVAAWIDGDLPAARTEALARMVRDDDAWSDAYRRAVVDRVAAPLVWDLPPLSPDHPRSVFRQWLPHAQAHLDVGRALGAWVLTTPYGSRHSSEGRFSWTDPLLGELSMQLTIEAPPRRLLLQAIGEAADALAENPDPALTQQLLAYYGEEVREALAEGAARFHDGKDDDAVRRLLRRPSDVEAATRPVTDRTTTDDQVADLTESTMTVTPLEELAEAAAIALSTRLRLDRVVAELDDLEFVVALDRADAACEAHAHALLLLHPDVLDQLTWPTDVLDPHQWWGIHQRLHDAMPDEVLDTLLTGDQP